MNKTLAKLVLAALLSAVLSACGGGEAEDAAEQQAEDVKTVQPLSCVRMPQKCS